MLLWVKDERVEEGQGRRRVQASAMNSRPMRVQPQPHLTLESVCILAAAGISNYSRDYFKIGLA